MAAPELIHVGALLGPQIAETAEGMARGGVRAVELGLPFDPSVEGATREAATFAHRALTAAGIEVRVVHPALGPGVDLSSADEGVRRQSIRHYRDALEACVLLGARLMVVHAGSQYALGEAAEAARRAADSVGQIVGDAESMGITLVIENLPGGYVLESGGEVRSFVDGFGTPTVRACYDSGHAHITGGAVGAIEALAPVLAHLHIHDNDGTGDQHRMLGLGSIDWQAVGDALRVAGYRGPALLELPLPEGHTAISMRDRALELMGYSPLAF